MSASEQRLRSYLSTVSQETDQRFVADIRSLLAVVEQQTAALEEIAELDRAWGDCATPDDFARMGNIARAALRAGTEQP